MAGISLEYNSDKLLKPSIYIAKEFEKIRKFLNLPPIELKFDEKFSGFAYNQITEDIFIQININEGYNSYLFKFFKYKLENRESRILFTISHELGHYWHYMKNKKDFIKCKKEYRAFNLLASILSKDEIYSQYRQLKAERIADKVGFYVLKNLYRLDLDKQNTECYT